VNIGRELFEHLSRHTESEGNFPFEIAFEYLAESRFRELWDAVHEAGQTIRPSISKHHEISISEDTALDKLKDGCRERELDPLIILRGLIYIVLNVREILDDLLERDDQRQLLRRSVPTKLEYRFARDIEIDYTFEEVPREPIDTTSGWSGYVTRCCDTSAFSDFDGNLFCPECGELVFYSEPLGFPCPHCGLRDIDEDQRCSECRVYVGTPTWVELSRVL
jgi:predicted RNA-binding Zn-ribbon protein involved in translation (DUF1610 family)